MARPKKSAGAAESGTASDANAEGVDNHQPGAEGALPAGTESAEPPPPRFSGDVLPCVEAAATTITGCTDAELKNYLATSDWVLRQLAVQLANNWKAICRTAKLQQDQGKNGKVRLGASIVIDHTNLLLMDTSVKLGFTQKFGESNDIQQDLRQVSFTLGGAAIGETEEEQSELPSAANG